MWITRQRTFQPSVLSRGSLISEKKRCLQRVSNGGHLEFLININLVVNHTKNIPAKFALKWFTDFRVKDCLQHAPHGGHLEFRINVNNITFLDDHTKNIPVNIALKWLQRKKMLQHFPQSGHLEFLIYTLNMTFVFFVFCFFF